MTVDDLKALPPYTGFKLRVLGGKWSPVLYFVGQKGDVLTFKPAEDTLSTTTRQVLSVYLASAADVRKIKVFIKCKFYDEWFKAPHVCGIDCGLEISHG